MIENRDPLRVLVSLQLQPIALFHPCLQLLVRLRPVNDFEIASVACNEEEIQRTARPAEEAIRREAFEGGGKYRSLRDWLDRQRREYAGKTGWMRIGRVCWRGI